MREGWVYQDRTPMGDGDYVDRYVHVSGAYVDDNTNFVPEDLKNEPEVVADTNFVGHRTDNDWEQFPTLDQAMVWATTDPATELRGH